MCLRLLMLKPVMGQVPDQAVLKRSNIHEIDYGGRLDVFFVRMYFSCCRRRITTVPYVILLDGAVWYPSSDADVPASSAIQKVLDGSSLQLPVYNSSDVAPKSRLVSIEMSSTNIINRSIAYQDMAMAQTMLEDCFGYGNGKYLTVKL